MLDISWERSQIIRRSRQYKDQYRDHAQEADRKQHGWTTFFNGLDTHWTRHSCVVKTQSSEDSSFMVWPSLGTRMAEGKERHMRYPCQLELWIGVNNTQDALPKLTILPVPAAVRIRLVTRNIAVLRDFEWWYIIGITVDDLQCISTHRWGLGLKVKRYRYSNKSSQSYRVSLAIWVHTMLWFVTCPRHKWTHQPDKPVLACFTYPAGVEGWELISVTIVTYRNGLPDHIWLSI